jgi:hypothetical protein
VCGNHQAHHDANESKREVGADHGCHGHGWISSRSSVRQESFHTALVASVCSATRSYRASVRLDHVVIAVTDFERSNTFYRDVLGAEVVERDGRIA